MYISIFLLLPNIIFILGAYLTRFQFTAAYPSVQAFDLAFAIHFVS